MTIPHFTAETSLYKSGARNALALASDKEASKEEGRAIIPQACFPVGPCIKPPGALLGTQFWFCTGFGWIGPLPCF